MGIAKKVSILALMMGFISAMPAQIFCQNNNTAEIPLMLSIPPVSLINFAVDGEQVITYSYSFLEPNNVEQIINPNTGDNTWLNYSSIVNPGATNYITANISSGSLPADVTLRVVISEDAGFGSGATGTPIGEITLSSYPQNIIVNIGSCYTGSGTNRGHRLTYIWDNPESYNYSN
ncbi:MAG: hypothetical protein KKB74_02215, partial [Bacteroidetes bacterium]|nr:hypothetical protein [Bacteroidota bacterium]